MSRLFLPHLLCALSVLCGETHAADFKVATFKIDATPPIGAPLCDGLVPPAAKIDDSLSARGIVLVSSDKPIVLCAVDWVGIGNGGNLAWREALATAAGTTADRVAVHTLHQHDAPGCDFSSETLLAAHGLAGRQFHVEDAKQKIAATADAVRAAMEKLQPVTHMSVGRAVVKEVASSRRLLGSDGKIASVRMSSCRDEKIRALPEGVIDPNVRLLAFYHGDKPIVSITWYATHPQSHYGKGAVSADFPGAARAMREKELPDVFHVHFNGAGGNVAAGKYNDGSPENRPRLASRLAAGMKEAWESAKREPISADAIRWSTRGVVLPAAAALDEKTLLAKLADDKLPERERVRAARDLTWLRRVNAKDEISIGCLALGESRVVFMPGELFVEYQLTAQAKRPEKFVAMAAYGDYGMGYIGTTVAYTQGGYETSYVSRVSPGAETILTAAVNELLAR